MDLLKFYTGSLADSSQQYTCDVYVCNAIYMAERYEIVVLPKLPKNP